MKIGILTYFWAENPGTYLQAFSTYMAVKSLYPKDKVEMINVKYRNTHFRPSKSSLFLPGYLLKSLGKYYSYKKGLDKSIFSTGGYVGKNTNKAIEYVKKQMYDIIYVGSDTVFKMYDWNRGIDSLSVYYLNEVYTKKVVLAASCCSTTIEDFTSDMKRTAYRCLNDFSKIGVRDKNTFDLFCELKGCPNGIEMVPDPTLTFKIDLVRTQDALLRYKYDFTTKCVLIDLPSNFPHLSETIKYFRNQKWNIVKYGYANYADYCLFLKPEEWAGLPYFVDLVITDRFHGSIFSLKNNTPVVGIDCNHKRVSKRNTSKVRALFDGYGIIENYINILNNPSCEQYLKIVANALKSKTNYTNINSKLKKKYLRYLESTLF